MFVSYKGLISDSFSNYAKRARNTQEFKHIGRTYWKHCSLFEIM